MRSSDQPPVAGASAFFSWSTKGLAKARKSATPTPIIATASSSATTMNIWVRSIGASSGWRAAPSRKRPPSRPIPIPTPSAPRPMRIATAIAVKPITVSIELLLVEKSLVMLVRLAEVHNRQHHENECLQQDNQDVEARPKYVQRRQLPQASQGDEHEDEFARVEVAEQSQ